MGGAPVRTLVLAAIALLALAPPPAASGSEGAHDAEAKRGRWIAYEAAIPPGGRVVLTVTLDDAELPAHVGAYLAPTAGSGPRYLFAALVTGEPTPTGTLVRTAGHLPLGATLNLVRHAPGEHGDVTLTFEYENVDAGAVRRHVAAWAGVRQDALVRDAHATVTVHDGAQLLAAADGGQVHLLTQEDFATGAELRADPLPGAPGANALLDARARLTAEHPLFGVYWQEPPTSTCAGNACAPTSLAVLSHRGPNGVSSGPRDAYAFLPGPAGAHEFTAHAWLAAHHDGTPPTSASERGHLVFMGASLALPRVP